MQQSGKDGPDHAGSMETVKSCPKQFGTAAHNSGGAVQYIEIPHTGGRFGLFHKQSETCQEKV